MSSHAVPTGPDREAITRTIRERHPDTVILELPGVTFFSLDATHWPNFATIVTTDEHDIGAPSNLDARPGSTPDHAALDRIAPHPVYARQRWISILNPTEASFRTIVLPLLAEAHDRVSAQHARQARSVPSAAASPE